MKSGVTVAREGKSLSPLSCVTLGRVPQSPQIVLENLSSPMPGLPHPLTNPRGL